MTRTRHTTHRAENCRWSVPALRRTLASDRDDDFEGFWACDSTGVRCAVMAEDCARCPYWAPERDRPAVQARRR